MKLINYVNFEKLEKRNRNRIVSLFITNYRKQLSFLNAETH